MLKNKPCVCVAVWLTTLLVYRLLFLERQKVLFSCVCLAPACSCVARPGCSKPGSPPGFLHTRSCQRARLQQEKCGGITTPMQRHVCMTFLKIRDWVFSCLTGNILENPWSREIHFTVAVPVHDLLNCDK